ncbi:hypothetical protein NIA70_10250 [[Clostridium] scindens]|uniref:hypothetical protein n=1 Tax=Clostridium scindens (strain JCM 10418 / VPI 12708) TaxID=29347 RepID=UPI0020971C96|nr:hypothetical protein [[Clostridium] scindens]MCO7172534.1 hypothetical protein [[Clostridium] scindens]
MRHYGYLEQIRHPEREWFSFLGGDDLTVIIHKDAGEKQLFFPDWQSCDNGDGMLTLDSIRKQVEDIHGRTIIVVMAENPLNGYVYRYGNYGDFWVQIGSVRGYA